MAGNVATRIVRRLRQLWQRWSREEDRDFHEALFAGEVDHDPFSFAYPGYLTIRRFADLAAPRLAGLGSAVDLGCGTGEVTCELAARHPSVFFRGIDHSPAGIERARRNAERRGLGNVAFEVADVEEHRPAGPVDIVLLFDSFHHLLDPAGFVAKWRGFTSRFLLLEPRGDWKGTWRKDLDLDWLPLELEKIRARLAQATGEADPPRGEHPALRSLAPGRAVEHRYSLDEIEAFFPGCNVEVRGTVAGLEVYPPDPHRRSPSRERFGRLAYDLMAEMDDKLFASNRDLLAKHWVVYAEAGAQRRERRRPPELTRPPEPEPVAGPYDVEYLAYEGARSAPAGAELTARVRLRNRSWQVWRARPLPGA